MIRKGITPMDTISVKMLDRNREAIRPHVNSGSLVNKSGPGFSPHIISPPRSTAPVPLPGIPSASSGANAPAAAALFAASLAAIPSMAPVPSSSSLLNFFWAAYPIKAPVVAPAPGSTPTKVPMIPDRMDGGRSLLKSCFVKRLPLMVSFISWFAFVSSPRSITSLMTWEKPTVPMINGVKGMPPSRYMLPKS